MQPSIFTKIINGELPCHKVYEDEKTFAFLDIQPVMPGHTLVVPKKQVDRLEDLPSEDYIALMTTVKKVMKRAVDVYGRDFRACVKVEGFEVPHVHVNVIPCRKATDFWTKQQTDGPPDHATLAKEAQKLFFA